MSRIEALRKTGWITQLLLTPTATVSLENRIGHLGSCDWFRIAGKRSRNIVRRLPLVKGRPPGGAPAESTAPTGPGAGHPRPVQVGLTASAPAILSADSPSACRRERQC